MIDVIYTRPGERFPYSIVINPACVNDALGERAFGDLVLDIITWIMEAFT